jgi:hypothetical protein
VGELLEADQGLQQLTGLETWFKLPGCNVPTMKPPPRWKMWLVSIVAVYPLVLVFQALVVPRMAGLSFPLRALNPRSPPDPRRRRGGGASAEPLEVRDRAVDHQRGLSPEGGQVLMPPRQPGNPIERQLFGEPAHSSCQQIPPPR